jgi:hypothetical protein
VAQESSGFLLRKGLGQKRERSFADYDPSIRPAQYGFSFLSLSLSRTRPAPGGSSDSSGVLWGQIYAIAAPGANLLKSDRPLTSTTPRCSSLSRALTVATRSSFSIETRPAGHSRLYGTHEMAHSDGYSCPFVPLWFNNHVLTCWYTLGRLLTIIARSCLASYKSTLRVAPGWLLSSCVACSPLAAG